MHPFRKALAAGAALFALAAAPLAAETVAIRAGSVITDAAGEASGPATIIVEDGKILSITPGHTAKADREIDLKDKTVLPGLIDLHTHLTGDPGGDFWKQATEPEEWGVVVGAKNARITALAGFTTVREAGSGQETAFSLRRGTAEGLIPGPRIIAAGPALSIIGGHADTNGFIPAVNQLLDTGYNCTGAVECAAKVRLASQNGADIIKITATGGVLSQQGRGLEAHFTPEEMKAIADTAHSLGLKVMAHAHGARGIQQAAEAGIDTIEHGTYLDEAAAKAMRERGVVLVPTLMALEGVSEGLGKGVYTPVVENKIRAVQPLMASLVSRARQYGVTVAFGTDAGVYQHGRNAEELALMRKQGMSDREVLASATTVAARVLGMESQIGKLAPGFSADIIAVAGNPLKDVSVLEKVDFVMVRGRVIE
ncbi:metal-dependent hydrolase family protein [Erythrobacter oryzae]|uniref:metal-dependent hydrolase family protein n=1 Tax=Erythrobacter oryzae TaxID=3019556 RepID=UPI002554E9E1|nr:amidohydrolase family protein [Erythrobacter sp. COR-2]